MVEVVSGGLSLVPLAWLSRLRRKASTALAAMAATSLATSGVSAALRRP